VFGSFLFIRRLLRKAVKVLFERFGDRPHISLYVDASVPPLSYGKVSLKFHLSRDPKSVSGGRRSHQYFGKPILSGRKEISLEDLPEEVRRKVESAEGVRDPVGKLPHDAFTSCVEAMAVSEGLDKLMDYIDRELENDPTGQKEKLFSSAVYSIHIDNRTVLYYLSRRLPTGGRISFDESAVSEPLFRFSEVKDYYEGLLDEITVKGKNFWGWLDEIVNKVNELVSYLESLGEGVVVEIEGREVSPESGKGNFQIVFNYVSSRMNPAHHAGEKTARVIKSVSVLK